LVGGLADENKRWGHNVETYKVDRTTMIGNALVSAAFVSYIGPFSYLFRQKLWKDTWLPDIISKNIPYTEGVDPLKVLATDADQAKWKTEGLPADRISLENASVITSCKRYPLMIDP
jgi:dynein heavy chain